MKRSNLKYFIAATLVAAGVTAVSMYSCEKENITPTGQVQMDYEKLAEPDQPSGPAVCGEVQRKQICWKMENRSEWHTAIMTQRSSTS